MIASAILVAGLALGGCASSGTPDDNTGGGGKDYITVAAAQGIPQLNPVIRTFQWDEVLFPLMWNGLTTTNEAGEIVPDLAETWDVSDDQTEWTFHLRSDVEFSNGKALTAQDVVDTFEYYMAPDTASQEQNKLQTVTDVTATDEHTVTVTLSEPNAVFAAGIVWVKVMDMDSLDTIDKEPAVTGPYAVKSFVPNDTLVLERNESYFGEAAAIPEIRIVNASESTAAVTGLQSGDIDVLWSVPRSNISELESNPDLTIISPDAPSLWVNWELDYSNSPFDNPKAREALQYAVDREAIVEVAYDGVGEVNWYSNPISQNSPWYSTEGQVKYSYDLQKAKELFAEAGIGEGDSITWWGVSGAYPEWVTSAQILQSSLAEIGIQLDIQNSEIGTWAAEFYPAGKAYPNMVVPNQQAVPGEPAYSLNFFLSGRCQCNWNSTEYDEAYKAALAEPDPELRAERWGEVQRLSNVNAIEVVPLLAPVVSVASSDLEGIWVESGGQLRLDSASFAR